jgi:hypothetical protein
VNKQLALSVVIGFVIGGVTGLLWGKSTRSNLAKNVTTEIDGGIISVKLDAGSAARQGVLGIFSD